MALVVQPGDQPVRKIEPTFLLRGVDPLQILNNYLKGVYISKVISGDKIKIKGVAVSIEDHVGTDSEYERYEYQSSSNSRQLIITTNHSTYAWVRDGGAEASRPRKPCAWCRRKFENEPLGYPISVVILEDKVIFHVHGNFCCFGCCFALVKRKTAYPRLMRDPLLDESESLLHMMFNMIYPDKTLISCPEWDLLEGDNGGPLSEDEFFSGVYEFRVTINVIMLPVKIEIARHKRL